MGDAAQPVPAALAPDTGLTQLVKRFAADERSALPVIDSDGALRGIVLAVEDQADDVTAAGLARTVPVIGSDRSLEDALKELTRHGGAALPIGMDGAVTGWLTHRDLLRAAAGVLSTH